MARNAVRLSKTLLDVQTFEDPAGTASKVILKFADGTSAECDVGMILYSLWAFDTRPDRF
jgi:hypothetical protein